MLSIEKVISATRAKLFGIVASTQGARSARFFLSLSICQAGLGWRQHTQLSICRLGWPSLSIWDKHIRLGGPGANAYKPQLSVHTTRATHPHWVLRNSGSAF